MAGAVNSAIILVEFANSQLELLADTKAIILTQLYDLSATSHLSPRYVLNFIIMRHYGFVKSNRGRITMTILSLPQALFRRPGLLAVIMVRGGGRDKRGLPYSHSDECCQGQCPYYDRPQSPAKRQIENQAPWARKKNPSKGRGFSICGSKQKKE